MYSSKDTSQLLLNLNREYWFINYIFLFFILIITLFMIFYLKRKNKLLNLKFMILLLLYNLTITLVHYYFTLIDINHDARLYFLNTFNFKNIWEGYGIAANFVIFFNNIWVKIFYLNYFVDTIFFSLFGYYGLIIYYLTLVERISDDKMAKRCLHILLFLPGLNFWTSFVGKEALIFLALTFVLFSLSHLKKRIFFFWVGWHS
jgi:hypothetical protein